MLKRCGIILVLMAAATVVAVVAIPGGAPSRAAAAPIRAAAASPSCPAGDRMMHFTVDGETHKALLYTPRGARGPMPLLLAFHGAQYGARFVERYYGLNPVADKHHFAILYPQASHNTFWELSPTQDEDVDAVRAVLDRIEKTGCIDSTRVYATGASNGGGFSARIGCELSDRLAAIAPVAGGYSALGPCQPSRAVPVLEIHGTRDEVVPYNGKPPDYAGSVGRFLGQWTALDGCRGSAQRTAPSRGVTVAVWRRCSGGSVVEHIRLAGTDHGWPGGSTARAGLKNHPIPRSDPTGLSAAEAVWSFVSRHRLPAR